MKRKTIILILTAAFALAAVFSGCSGSSGSGGSSSDGSVTELTLKVWAPANQIENGTLEKMGNLFNERNPQWKITFVNSIVGEDQAANEILKDVAAAGDVFFFANDQLENLLGAGAIARLGGDVETMVKGTMAKTVVDTVTVDGRLYGIPFTHNLFFMYYDKTLLSSDDIKSIDSIMAKPTAADVYNFQFNPAGGWMGGSWFYGASLTIYGEDQVSFDQGCNWNNPTGVAVTKYLIDLINSPKSIFDGDGSPSELAASHRLGAWFDGAWNYNLYKDVLGDNLGLAPLPTFTVNGTAHQLKGFYGSKAIGVNALSQHMEQAVAFAAFLGSEEMQVLRFEESAQIPTNMKAGDSAAVLADEVAVVTMKAAEISAVMQPTSANFGNNYWANAGALFTEIRSGILNHDNVQEKLDTFVNLMKVN